MREMPLPVIAICLLTTVGLTVYIIRQYLRGEHDLLSYRNLFLVGFIHFQSTSAFLSGLTNEPWRGQPFAPKSYYLFAIGLVVFTLTFIWAYNRKTIPRIMGKIVPVRSPLPAPTWLYAGVVIGVLTGIISIAIVRANVPVLSQIAAQTVFGGMTFAVILAIYMWVKSPANPFNVILVLILPLFTIALSTIGSHGRRELVGVMIGLVWGIYLFKWRYELPSRTLMRFAIMGIVAAVPLILYTSVRGVHHGAWGVDEQDVGTIARMRLKGLMTADLFKDGVLPIMFTDTGLCSVYAIDRWGTDYDKPHEPFFSAKYVLVNPIPRAFWPEKPIAYGKTMPLSYKKHEFMVVTFGPGVIGHAWHEFGLIGFPLFGLAFGSICKMMDARVFRQALNPFVIAAAGAILGHVIGMPRGDIGVFMLNAIGGSISAFGTVLLLGLVSGGKGDKLAAAQLDAMTGGAELVEDLPADGEVDPAIGGAVAPA
jgi:hypothetical protein